MSHAPTFWGFHLNCISLLAKGPHHHVERCENCVRIKTCYLLPMKKGIWNLIWDRYRLEQFYQFPVFISITAILCATITSVTVFCIPVIKAHSIFSQVSRKHFLSLLRQYVDRNQRLFTIPDSVREMLALSNTRIAVINSFAKTWQCRLILEDVSSLCRTPCKEAY